MAEIRCPQCNSKSLYKDGLRYTSAGTIQRWLCRVCGYRFSQPNIKRHVSAKSTELLKPGPDLAKNVIRNRNLSLKESFNSSLFFRSENVGPQVSNPHITILGKDLNKFCAYNSECQVCASEQEAKNLIKVETQTEKAAGATKTTVKSEILQFLWQCKKQGLKETTITNYDTYLKMLINSGANLLNPESVKEVIANKKWCANTKFSATHIYTKFLESKGLSWEPPRYRRTYKLPFIPIESELDSLISGTRTKLATFLQLLKETGMRCGEAWRLKWIDVDFKNQTVTVNDPEKHGNPRRLKISSTLTAMLKARQNSNNKIFNGSLKAFRETFLNNRKKLTVKLKNPRLLRITFHTFRHWKATMEYHKTKDILHVKQLLGHKDINTTLLYTQLVNFESDEYHSKTASTAKEAEQLIEAGFEYVCTTPEDVMLFRKRK